MSNFSGTHHHEHSPRKIPCHRSFKERSSSWECSTTSRSVPVRTNQNACGTRERAQIVLEISRMVVGVFLGSRDKEKRHGTSNDKPKVKWNDIAHQNDKTLPIDPTPGLPMFSPTGDASAQMQTLTTNYSLQCRFWQSWAADENDFGSKSMKNLPLCQSGAKKWRRWINASLVLILSCLSKMSPHSHSTYPCFTGAVMRPTVFHNFKLVREVSKRSAQGTLVQEMHKDANHLGFVVTTPSLAQRLLCNRDQDQLCAIRTHCHFHVHHTGTRQLHDTAFGKKHTLNEVVCQCTDGHLVAIHDF